VSARQRSDVEESPPTGIERFERLYTASPDPWGYCSSDYEREKYADTLAALPGDEKLGAVLETGCSIGVFTALLAARSKQVLGVDFSPKALALARARTERLDNVRLLQASFPEQVPAGMWDVVICSEILYYLQPPALRQAIGWLAAQLQSGACVVAVSWRGGGTDEPLRGDDVHDLLAHELARWHTHDGRRPGYRLDRFESDAS
jgi:SAM-dependent methyltransferase